VVKGECILVIDDEEALRDGCKEALTEKGYVTVTAEDGESGLQLIRAGGPAGDREHPPEYGEDCHYRILDRVLCSGSDAEGSR
jgi:CheY-like chemotaxis protein